MQGNSLFLSKLNHGLGTKNSSFCGLHSQRGNNVGRKKPISSGKTICSKTRLYINRGGVNDLQHIINLQMNSPQKHSTDSRSVRLIYLATRNDLLIFVKQNSSRKKYNPPTNPMGTACFQAPLGKSRTFLRKKLVRSVGFNIFNDNHELHVSKDTITQRKLQIIKTLGNPNTLNFRRHIWTPKKF